MSRINQPEGIDEWSIISLVAKDRMMKILVNDSPHMTIEKAQSIVDFFIIHKMYGAWNASDLTIAWHADGVEAFINEHFTYEFRNVALADS